MKAMCIYEWKKVYAAAICGAALLSGVTAFGAASTLTVNEKGEATISSGDGYSLTAADSETLYTIFTLYSGLTIDGESCGGLTNSQSVTIGPWLGSPPAIVTITNGARWVTGRNKQFKFTREGGTIVVSEPSAHSWTWKAGTQVSTALGNIYTNMIGTVGYGSKFVVQDTAVADAGTMDILRLLPNGWASFQAITNGCASVAARVLFEGGELVSTSEYEPKFQTAAGTRIVLQSVNSNPIVLRTTNTDYELFRGEGTLETAGDGDFILLQHYSNTKTVTLGSDNGSIVWGHSGDFLLGGRMCLKLTSDDVLPHGEGKGRVVFNVNHKKYSNVGTSADKPVTLDLNGRSVTVNALVQDTGEGAYYSKWHVVTNSSETVATLGLDVYSEERLHEIMTTNLAANAASSIRLKKIGAGKLLVNNDRATNVLERVAGTEVADGVLYFYASYPLTRPLSVTGSGSIQVKSDTQYTPVTLDLSAIPDADLSIGGLTVDTAYYYGKIPTITKFRPAANGKLYLTNVTGEIASNYTVPINLTTVVDAENFASWKVCVNGVESRGLVPVFANGVLKVRQKYGTVIFVR